MIEELRRRNVAESTIRSYVHGVKRFSQYFHRRPDRLGPQHIREYQAMLFSKLKYSIYVSGRGQISALSAAYEVRLALQQILANTQKIENSLDHQRHVLCDAHKRISAVQKGSQIPLANSNRTYSRIRPIRLCQKVYLEKHKKHETKRKGAQRIPKYWSACAYLLRISKGRQTPFWHL